ncbi:unnamed protein product [Brassica rapa]|uniref:F-box associated beta-propeller type 1 domain-containing protein n=1 Tax=Brassica campestris TaxID=3711 RepID=A0A8D9H1K4_BRACM|nr:unnamed protein product [Brassica rapa]
MFLDYNVYLVNINLLNPSIERIGKLVDPDDNTADGVNISNIFYCQGLFLCVTKHRTRLVVWNPFNGQTRWIQPRHYYHLHMTGMLLDTRRGSTARGEATKF